MNKKKNCTNCKHFVSFRDDYCDDMEPDDQGFCHEGRSLYFGNEGAGRCVICEYHNATESPPEIILNNLIDNVKKTHEIIELLKRAREIKIPTDECIEQWWAEGKYEDKRFWKQAPYRTNGDVIEEIKMAVKYFMETWQKCK